MDILKRVIPPCMAYILKLFLDIVPDNNTMHVA